MDDQQAIRKLIDDWSIARDTGDWARLAALWHPEARMITTWCQVSAADFIARCRAVWEAGTVVMHAHGGCSIEVRGDRAVAQTRVVITQRGVVHGVMVNVDCRGRFWDALEKRAGRWGIVLRHPIYEIDSMSPVDLGVRLELDRVLLESFPIGYRHLAYLQSQSGQTVRKDLPGTRGPAVERLLSCGVRWLDGEGPQCLEQPY